MGTPLQINPNGSPLNRKFTFGPIQKFLGDLFSKADVDTGDTKTYIGSDVEARQSNTDGANPVNTLWLQGYVDEQTMVEAGRLAAYKDYDQMDDEFPEICSALDIVAEFATQSDTPAAETFQIECTQDQALGKELNDIAKQLKLDIYCTAQAREVAKYGGTFLELIASDEEEAGGQIVASKPLDPATMRRNEDKYGRLKDGDGKDSAFTQVDKDGKPVAQFKAWQIVHFRFRRQLTHPYGNSLYESGRRIFKQLRLMEDGMVMARMYRSHMRFVFRIPVEGLSVAETETYMKKVIKSMKTKKRFDQSSQQLRSAPAPMTAGEDFYVPTRKDASSDVTALQGAGNLGDLKDVEYFRNKLFASGKVPKELLGVSDPAAARATSVIKDMNFARCLRAIQQIMAAGIKSALERALIAQGKILAELPEWNVVFPAVSTVDEKLQWETEFLKAQVAQIYHFAMGLLSDEWIYSHYLDMTPEEIAKEKANQKNNPPQQRAVQQSQNMLAVAKARSGVPDSSRPGPNGGPAVPKPRVSPYGAEQQTEEDLQIVREMRKIMNVPMDEAMRPGEVELAQHIRAMQMVFGEVNINTEIFERTFGKARNMNGHKPPTIERNNGVVIVG